MFDDVSQWKSGDLLVRYGCIYGNEKIVFIKAGAGGDHLGQENKYLRIGRRLHRLYGCSVISISNPYSKSNRVDCDRSILDNFIQKQNLKCPPLYFFGHSNGCIKGLELAASGTVFQKMMLVNMPLMINFHKTKGWLAEIPQTHVMAVYGEHDPSYPYVPFIDGKMDHLKTRIIPGADHNFAGRIEQFICLADYLLCVEA